MPNEFSEVDNAELIQMLIDANMGRLVDVLLTASSYRGKRNRLNKTQVCKALDCSYGELDRALEHCRLILGDVL